MGIIDEGFGLMAKFKDKDTAEMQHYPAKTKIENFWTIINNCETEEEEFIVQEYNKVLAFNYGDVATLILSLTKSLELYFNAKNKQHPLVKHRIKLYSKIIKYAKRKNQKRGLQTGVLCL